MDSKYYSARDRATPRRSCPPDYTTAEGAARLKAKIEEALKRKGLKLPTFDVKYVPGSHLLSGDDGRPRYDLRSDMLNGFPPKGDAA